MAENYAFAPEGAKASTPQTKPWKLLIVDDDTSIHQVTTLALQDLVFKDRKMVCSSAFSAKEAIALLKEVPDFAIVLLDIGMETADAGLEVARFIRQELDNTLTRIIIRTGQPGYVPEREIIDRFDINDYKYKTDLTIEKLFTTIRTALAQYDQIHALSQLNQELEERIRQALEKQQQQQDALLAHNRNIQMGEMLNMLAHQWRQPLSRIAAVTAQLKFSLALDEMDINAFTEQIDHIENYTHELSGTIDQFKELYEPSQTNKTLPVHTVLTQCISMVKSHFESQQINILYTPINDLKTTPVCHELSQVIISLLKNAQEAFMVNRVENPTITICLSKTSEHFCIQVHDNAGGIPTNDLAKVCDPYFSTKPNKNGQGLGLYMSQKIVQQHCHGHLTITNENQGTLASIYIRP